MQITEVLDLVPNSDLIRIVEGNKEIYAGYRGQLEERIEGEVVKISISSEVWKRKQNYCGLHKGEIELVEQIHPETVGEYNFRDLTVKLIMKLNIKK